jgi:gluconolactonase
MPKGGAGMNVEIRDPRFQTVVGDDVAFEQLGTGFLFTEGAIWHPYEQHLTFSDVPGSHMRRWSAAGGVVTFREPSNMANGNTYDREGRIVTCEHATSRVTRTEPDGAITVLASHWDGKELNSPNDIVVKSDGGIYFTDPTYGRWEYYGVPRDPELPFRGVYRVEPDGTDLKLLADDFEQPNGLCFSRDETRLFVNDTIREEIRVFDVGADGGLSNSRVWAKPSGDRDGNPDGMKVDSAENLYCTGPGGIHVFAPDAACLGVILTPEWTANFTWGDADMRSLFITASTSLYRIRVKVPGNALF